MTDSAAARPVLTHEQVLDLNYLKLTWAKFYEITCDGGRWTAVPLGTQTALTADSKDGLHKILRVDAYTRVTRNGHWVETASGPPYFVETPHPQPRDPRG
jgi:hypothetical protein